MNHPEKTGTHYRLPKKLDKHLDNLVSEGVFSTKQGVVTYAVAKFLIDLHVISPSGTEAETRQTEAFADAR